MYAPSSLLIKVLCGVFGSIVLLGCATQSIPNPPVEQFAKPAIGTPIPTGKDVVPVNLPTGSSGVMVVNNKSISIRVAVSDTIATIEPSEGFLFILPPSTYQFYLYESDMPIGSRVEQIEVGKVRYVYITTVPRRTSSP
jgi:hypothetical protein